VTRWRLFWGIPWVIAVASQTGCSGGTGDSPTSSCPTFDYAGYAPTDDPSFQHDIRPILTLSCAQLSCHGSYGAFPANEPRQRPLDLGPPANEPAPDAATVQRIHDDLIMPSVTAPAMAIVKPGDPAESFLMHKVDGDQLCSAIDCPKEGCGKRMPNVDGFELDAASANQIRAWIKQGAKSN